MPGCSLCHSGIVLYHENGETSGASGDAANQRKADRDGSHYYRLFKDLKLGAYTSAGTEESGSILYRDHQQQAGIPALC